jgi:hypothetical protein
MPNVRTALATGMALITVAGVLVLSRSPPVVLASNSIEPNSELALTGNDANACQGRERLPGGTTAIRLSLAAFTGPAVTVRAVSGTRTIAAGEHGSGWDGKTVTVPVKALSVPISPVKICFAVSTVGAEPVKLFGSDTKPAVAARSGGGEALRGRLTVEYLGDGHASWLSLLPTVARNMGFGRAWSGAWVAFLVALLMLGATAIVLRVVARELHE